ncbi:hypothetical protein GCM10009839_90600 [Catenulispora yoronensis]|uniref:DUF47 family protein n=1 Tax=Catenulispora yoronensis TaxID=450799 RepID=A0ABN2VKL7_9ACTN
MAASGADLTCALLNGAVDMDVARARMESIEHDGDDRRAALLAILGATLSPPVDREDLNRVSRSIDDVLDTLRDFVRETDLYRVGDLSRYRDLATLVSGSIRTLDEAVAALAPGSDLRAATLAARKAAGAVVRAYQYEVAALLTGGTPERDAAEAMKARELYRRLGDVGLRLGDAADGLADGAMKRGR